MLKNNLLIALRSLLKNKFFSLLNIVGLALGMAVCLTTILLIRQQFNFDRFHANGDRLFRILTKSEDETMLASTAEPLAAELQNFAAVERTTSIVRGLWRVDAQISTGLALPMSGYFADPSFFQTFNFSLEKGDAATALVAPDGLVLSKKMAKKLFGSAEPMGQTVVLREKGSFRVTGIMAEPPGRTHLSFDCLAATAALAALEKKLPEDSGERILGNWENYYMSHVYIVLKQGHTERELAAALASLAENRSKSSKSDAKNTYLTQKLAEISPIRQRVANDSTPAAPMFFLYGLGFFAVLLTVFPCLNYANMAIARSLERAREIGVRKAIGAGAANVRRLILAEAMLTAGFALVAAWALHLPLNNFVKTYFPPEADLSELRAGPADWLIFIAYAAFVGLLAGWIPAKRLAALKPTSALRGIGFSPKRRRFSWRKGMMVGQFTLSLVLATAATTVWRQIEFMSLADYGFQKENVLTVELNGNKAAVVAAEFSKNAAVVGCAPTSLLIASNSLQGTLMKKKPGGDPIDLHNLQTDANYIPVMGLELIAGQNFPDFRADSSSEELIILNEKALQVFELGSPAAAVGQTIFFDDDRTPVRILGVVKDFHYRTFEDPIGAFGLRYGAPDSWLMHVRLTSGDPAAQLAALTAIWKKIDPVHPLEAHFMDESIEKSIAPVVMVGRLTGFFAFFALMLAAMGLLGAATYAVGSRVKEIGIRKTLGATTAQVVFVLSRQFLMLLCLSIIIAAPFSVLLTRAFFNLFAYRAEVGPTLFAACATGLLALGLATVGSQAVRAALANPVKSLRSE